MTGDEALGVKNRTPDSTGDPYEDFPDDHGQTLSGSEAAKIAMELKGYGNKAFKANDLDLGLDKYQKGLRYLNEAPDVPKNDSPELAKELNNTRFALHSNSALLQVKLKAFDDGLRSASNALDLEGIADADRAKAFYRRALARIGLKEDDDALKDLDAALKLAPGDAAITKELVAVKKRASEQAKKEKAAYKKFFD